MKTCQKIILLNILFLLFTQMNAFAEYPSLKILNNIEFGMSSEKLKEIYPSAKSNANNNYSIDPIINEYKTYSVSLHFNNTKQPPAEAGGFKACGLKVQLHRGYSIDIFATPMKAVKDRRCCIAIASRKIQPRAESCPAESRGF